MEARSKIKWEPILEPEFHYWTKSHYWCIITLFFIFSLFIPLLKRFVDWNKIAPQAHIFLQSSLLPHWDVPPAVSFLQSSRFPTNLWRFSHSSDDSSNLSFPPLTQFVQDKCVVSPTCVPFASPPFYADTKVSNFSIKAHAIFRPLISICLHGELLHFVT